VWPWRAPNGFPARCSGSLLVNKSGSFFASAEACRFFIVCDNKIVEESLEFRDYPESGFDPSVFLPDDDEPWRQAWVRFWYRKFYTQSEFGQLMGLRPDAPELYYYPSRLGTNSIQVLQAEFRRIRWLLVVFIFGFVFWFGLWLSSVTGARPQEQADRRRIFSGQFELLFLRSCLA
jgi:hypothetical protein